MMTGGPMKGKAPKKQGKIGQAIDRMKAGRMGKLEAKSEMAADQGNDVKSKRLSNRAEKVENRMELKSMKKGTSLPPGKKIGEYIGKNAVDKYVPSVIKGSMGATDKSIPETSEDYQNKTKSLTMKRLGKKMNY